MVKKGGQPPFNTLLQPWSEYETDPFSVETSDGNTDLRQHLDYSLVLTTMKQRTQLSPTQIYDLQKR